MPTDAGDEQRGRRAAVAGDPGTLAEMIWAAVPDGAGVGADAGSRRRWLLANVARGERVLDAGCGLGDDVAALAAAGAEAVGVDVAPTALRRARVRQGGPSAPALDLREVPEGGALPFDDGAFDVVWASEVIEHVVDVATWLSELRRVLAPSGRVLLTTPYHGRVQAALISLMRFEDHFDPRSDRLRFMTRRSLTALLDAFGFESVEVRAAGGVPLLRRTLLATGRRASWSMAPRGSG